MRTAIFLTLLLLSQDPSPLVLTVVLEQENYLPLEPVHAVLVIENRSDRPVEFTRQEARVFVTPPGESKPVRYRPVEPAVISFSGFPSKVLKPKETYAQLIHVDWAGEPKGDYWHFFSDPGEYRIRWEFGTLSTESVLRVREPDGLDAAAWKELKRNSLSRFFSELGFRTFQGDPDLKSFAEAHSKTSYGSLARLAMAIRNTIRPGRPREFGTDAPRDAEKTLEALRAIADPRWKPQALYYVARILKLTDLEGAEPILRDLMKHPFYRHAASILLRDVVVSRELLKEEEDSAPRPRAEWLKVYEAYKKTPRPEPRPASGSGDWIVELKTPVEVLPYTDVWTLVLFTRNSDKPWNAPDGVPVTYRIGKSAEIKRDAFPKFPGEGVKKGDVYGYAHKGVFYTDRRTSLISEPGEYEISVEAEGFGKASARLKVRAPGQDDAEAVQSFKDDPSWCGKFLPRLNDGVGPLRAFITEHARSEYAGWAKLALARIMGTVKSTPEQRAVLRELAWSDHPLSARAAFELAEIYGNAGRWPRAKYEIAERYYKLAFWKQPNDPALLFLVLAALKSASPDVPPN